MYRYENIVYSEGTSNVIRVADKILAHGWQLGAYQPINLKKEIPWHLTNQELRSHNFHIQCLDMIDPLLKAHSHSHDNKYVEAAMRIALDWITKHADVSGTTISPFAWYDMSVGLRAYRLAYLYDAAEHAGLRDEEARQILWLSLEQHARYLEDDANIVFRNNHGYYQIAGQLAMGRRFAARSDIMGKALSQGRQRLKRILEQQFTPEGVHREHSPDYHRMVYSTLRALIDSGLVEDEEIIGFAKKVEEALSWFILPNQHIVNFGDSDDRALTSLVKGAAEKWVTPEMQFWVSGAKIGIPSYDVVRAFRASGYWIVRKRGCDLRDLPRYSYLAFNAAFHSRVHKHADDLSFVWFDRGHNLLVDAGRYGYIGKSAPGSDLWLDGHWYDNQWRVYCESTRAHNALEFDGRNYRRRKVTPYGSALKRWGEHKSGLLFVEAEVKHFGSIKHARMLLFMPGLWLIVVDWFHDDSDMPHTARQWFHVAHGLEVAVDQQQCLVTVPGSGQLLRVVPLIHGQTRSRLYFGEKEPLIQGWWSGKERHIVPNYAFCFEHPEAITGTIATLFSFSDKLEADQAWSKINVSGRKGQFQWKDEKGAHKLFFERPADGNLTVVYIPT